MRAISCDDIFGPLARFVVLKHLVFLYIGHNDFAPFFVKDTGVALLGHVGLIAFAAKVSQFLAAELDSAIVISKAEFRFEYEVLVRLIGDKESVLLDLLVVGRTDDDSVFH